MTHLLQHLPIATWPSRCWRLYRRWPRQSRSTSLTRRAQLLLPIRRGLGLVLLCVGHVVLSIGVMGNVDIMRHGNQNHAQRRRWANLRCRPLANPADLMLSLERFLPSILAALVAHLSRILELEHPAYAFAHMLRSMVCRNSAGMRKLSSICNPLVATVFLSLNLSFHHCSRQEPPEVDLQVDTRPNRQRQTPPSGS